MDYYENQYGDVTPDVSLPSQEGDWHESEGDSGFTPGGGPSVEKQPGADDPMAGGGLGTEQPASVSDQPSVESAGAVPETPAETPAVSPTGLPDEAPVEAPIDAPVDPLAETPAEAPMAPAENPDMAQVPPVEPEATAQLTPEWATGQKPTDIHPPKVYSEEHSDLIEDKTMAERMVKVDELYGAAAKLDKIPGCEQGAEEMRAEAKQKEDELGQEYKEIQKKAADEMKKIAIWVNTGKGATRDDFENGLSVLKIDEEAVNSVLANMVMMYFNPELDSVKIGVGKNPSGPPEYNNYSYKSRVYGRSVDILISEDAAKKSIKTILFHSRPSMD